MTTNTKKQSLNDLKNSTKLAANDDLTANLNANSSISSGNMSSSSDKTMMSGYSDLKDTDSSGKKKGCSDFINVPLIPLKIILFSWYAAGACLLPYMTLHMKQLGLTALEQTAVYTVLPIIQLIGTPIAGFMADRLGNYKPVLCITLKACIITTLMIQFLVPARKPKLLNALPEDEDSSAKTLYMVTFWMYLIIRIFHQVCVGLSYVLLDTTTIVLAEENNSNYGRQRFWAILATGIFSPICGFIIDHISTTKGPDNQTIINFDPAFYFFEGFTLITLLMTSLIKIKISAPATNVLGNISPLLRSGTIWIFLFSVFIMGSCWGFLESFLFIFLQELKAPNYLMGLTVTIGAFIGLPFLYCSEWFVNKFGAVQLILLALFIYFIRLVGYSFIENYWFCIPYELMEAFTFHLMWVSTVRLAYQIAPNGMLATLQAIVGGLNFGVGRGFGSFIGGTSLAIFGTRIAFRVIGGMALITGIFYATCHYTCLSDIESYNKDKKANRRRQTTKDMAASRSDNEAA